MRLAAEDRPSCSKLKLLNWINIPHWQAAGGNATGNLAVTGKYVLKDLFKPMLHNGSSLQPSAVLASCHSGGVQTDTMRLYGNIKEHIHAFALTFSTYIGKDWKKRDISSLSHTLNGIFLSLVKSNWRNHRHLANFFYIYCIYIYFFLLWSTWIYSTMLLL